ncbi:MAG TPA: FAD-dependent oxidoreductase [Ohtaekwangia sp.]|nr:FAD-dependent oxidoreductase [Ohtaekwangia sp.]
MKNVAIIGGGIIGLSTAYYLTKAGHSVTIFDQGNLKDNCSSGNAGMIVPSHIIPLAAPGMIAKGIRWMFNSSSPFYVKPRLSRDLISWGMKFYSHANHKHVEKSIPVLRDLSLLSKGLYQQIAKEKDFQFGYEERGLLMLYKSAETEREEKEATHLANSNGVEAHVLSATEVQALEPEVEVNARGGVYFPGDAHLIPHKFIDDLIQHLGASGVEMNTETKVTNFDVVADRIVSLETKEGHRKFDEFVIATGAWSGLFCAQLGISVPMQSGKGYSFTLDNIEKNIRIPTILLEGRVAVTPMGSSLRFGGTMEINGTDRSVNMNRVKGIVDNIPKYYPTMKVQMPELSNVWNGLRPCSPDGLPYIGKSKTFGNLVIATGHSMMGLSLGPVTGFLVSELISDKKTSMDLTPFNPERFK